MIYRSMFPGDLFAQLDRIERSLHQSMDTEPSIRRFGAGGFPALNIGSTQKGLADLPGVSRDNVHLRLEAQSLTIEAAMTLDLPADMAPRHVEVRHQHYERTFALSRELNAEQATAELNHGVLTIRIPKSQDAMPRKIPVNAG